MDNEQLNKLRQPWLSALDELKQEWPHANVQIAIGSEGRVGIYRNNTLMTNRSLCQRRWLCSINTERCD